MSRKLVIFHRDNLAVGIHPKNLHESLIPLFYPKTSNFHNSEMIGRRKLTDLSMNNIFNVLSIGLQYTLSFK